MYNTDLGFYLKQMADYCESASRCLQDGENLPSIDVITLALASKNLYNRMNKLAEKRENEDAIT